jgi:hypothetical protein
MIGDELILRVERLRSSLEELRRDLRDTYQSGAQVNSVQLRDEGRRIAESWMVEVSTYPEVKATLASVIGDLNIQFTRLLTYSERRSLRRLYDDAIRSILKDFHVKVVIPLKQARETTPTAEHSQPLEPIPFAAVHSAFVGHSFAPSDKSVVDPVIRLFQAFNIRVETGERPAARPVSDKVRRRIDRCDAFVGIFSRRDKLSGKTAYTTSTWVIDEKAYAVGKDKKLVLLKDHLVDSVGGLQGDYEYLEFDPDDVADLLVRLVEALLGRD